MPYGGNDWLALTQEPTLEPDLPICDAHHHFWDFRTDRIPYQRYLLHELAADAIVGHANLNLGERVQPVLEALHAASPNRFRGIRHTVTWDPHPEVASREKEGVLATADFRAGAQVLARMGLSLDTGVCFPQLPELAAFAQAVPELTIILNHLGGLMRVGPYGNRDDEVLATWRRGLAAVAACPNVYLKLGGIGMPRLGFDWHERPIPIGSEELATFMAPIM